MASRDALTLNYDFLFKTLLVGDSGVGKSALLLRYCDSFYNDAYISTIGVDFKVKTVPIDETNKIAKLQLWDTAGQERFRTIVASYYRGAHAIALCFDITNRISFRNVKQWLQEVERFANPAVVKILVGLKADNDKGRAVSIEEATALAADLNMKYLECSAKTGSGIEQVFTLITRQLFEKRATLSIPHRPPTSTDPATAVKDKLSRSCKIDPKSVDCCVIS